MSAMAVFGEAVSMRCLFSYPDICLPETEAQTLESGAEPPDILAEMPLPPLHIKLAVGFNLQNLHETIRRKLRLMLLSCSE